MTAIEKGWKSDTNTVTRTQFLFSMSKARLLENKYVDRMVKKDGIPEVPKCVEHATVIWSIYRGPKQRRVILYD